jgi:hypothetical protein
MPPKDIDGKIEFEAAAEERRLLNLLRVRSFTVNPASIHPFEKATLAWDVFVPPIVAEIGVTFTLSGRNVANPGSQVVSPAATGAFALEAHSDLTRRFLGSKVVQVDAGDCQEASLPRASIQFQAQTAKDLFRAGTLSSRGDLTVKMRPPGALFIEVPLKANIPNFFDADIDIDLTVNIFVTARAGGRTVIGTQLADVSVDVIFHPLEHILSQGSATAAQALIQPLAADLIKSFLGSQLEAAIATPIQAAINIFLDLWKGQDPANREFRLHSIEAQADAAAGLIILGCPLPPPPRPPVVKGKRKPRVPKR